MTKSKKIISILMAAAVLACLGVSAFADAGTAHTITISNSDATEAHAYTAYQVFVGTYDESTGTLSDAVWGSGVNSAALLADLQGDALYASCNSAADVTNVLTGLADNSSELRSFAAYVDANLATIAGSASGSAASDAVINVTGDGYYYVKDTSASLSNDTYSDYILLVEGDVRVEAKDSDCVTSEKKVKDVNDSTGVESAWQDSADYDIGDAVPFKITGTVGADYANYTAYQYIFHDHMENGLTFNANSVVVYVDGSQITSGYSVVADAADGCTFEIVFADLKATPAAANSEITVEYTATLNDGAVIGNVGNSNYMNVQYSNNPTNPDSLGATPQDKVKVFTYDAIIYKIDENGGALAGADFKLEKWIEDASYAEGGYWAEIDKYVDPQASGTQGRILMVNGIVVDYVTATNGDVYIHFKDYNTNGVYDDIYLKLNNLEAIESIVEAGTPTGLYAYQQSTEGVFELATGRWSYTVESISRAAGADSTFEWKGIDDGVYRISEIATPSGYNAIAPIEFTVEAAHDADGDDPALTALTGAGNSISFTNESGILSASIQNHRGAVLPSTGGIGTTIFYTVGALLVVSAGVLLVVKKRMGETK